MTKKKSGSDAFIKFCVPQRTWDLFKDSCDYYGYSRSELLRDFVERWNQEWVAILEEHLEKKPSS